MDEEITTMLNRKVWHLAEIKNNLQPVGCRWVYNIKQNEKGEIIKYKARLVAQGFKQIKGLNYEETFSPVVNFNIIRFFFAILVSLKKWMHIQCDVKGAYLYAPLTENIYMNQPPGFITKGKEHLFCKLDKAIYGLHQSGREWFYEINRVLEEINFKKLSWSNCVYINDLQAVLLLYVDDIVIFGKNEKIINDSLELLQKHFELKILGRTRKLLGVEFEENENLKIHQMSYIHEVFNRFNSFNIPMSSLPISKGIIYSKVNCPKSNEEKEEMSHKPYRSLLGCLSFLALRTRPDICYAVNIFSQFQENPGMQQWYGLLRLLGYVKHTEKLKLKLDCNSLQLITYSDADFAANRDDRTSLGGQVIFLGNSPIAWRTFKEKCISLSTMEAEFVAMTEASKELIWYNRILTECFERGVLRNNKVKPILYVENKATIDFVKSPIENYRSKHIDVKLFFVRDLVNQEIFYLQFINSKENLADVFTKPLTKHGLNNFKEFVF